MRSKQDLLNEIKNNLKFIKKIGGYIDQYDGKLFELFIESYRDNHQLTADAINDFLQADINYTSIKDKYDTDKLFYEKWLRWIEAFEKGFSNGYIMWKN